MFSKARGGFGSGGETGGRIGTHFGDMLERDVYDPYKSHIGLARGGTMQAAGVGQQIEDKVSKWWNDWFGSLARGGMPSRARGGVSVFK